MWVPLLSQLPSRVSPEICVRIFFSGVAWLWSFVGWSGFVPSVWFCLFIKDRSLRQCTFSSLQFSPSFSSVHKIDCFHFHMQKETLFFFWFDMLHWAFAFCWAPTDVKRKKKGNKKVPHLITLSSPKLLLLFSASDVLPVPACLWLIVIHFLCFLFLVCADHVPVRGIQRKGSQKSRADTWEETRLTPKRYCCNSISL